MTASAVETFTGVIPSSPPFCEVSLGGLDLAQPQPCCRMIVMARSVPNVVIFKNEE